MTPLKAERIRRLLQQKQVAEELGITEQYYNEIENGRRPSMKLALKLCEYFGKTFDELFRA